MYTTKTFSELKVGVRESISKKVTQELVRGFAEISEDYNPVHLDKEYAKTTIFGDNIAHGMLGASLISAVLGTRLPGIGSIYLSQDLKFKAPVFFGDVLTATAEIAELDQEKKRVKLLTWCENQEGKKVVEGMAQILFNQ